MKREATKNGPGNKRRHMEWHYSFGQEIIDMVVDNFDKRMDRRALLSLCEVSASWQHAALKKLYSVFYISLLHKTRYTPYLAKYVKKFIFDSPSCYDCDTLKTIEFPNLEKVHFHHDNCCSNVQQFFAQNTSIQHAYMNRMSIDSMAGLEAIMNARMQAPNYQPLLTFGGPLNETIATYLHKLGTQSIHAWRIDPDDIVSSFSQFSDLEDILLGIPNFGEERVVIEALEYLSKFKSLSCFNLNKFRGWPTHDTENYINSHFSQDVFTALVENVLKPNVATLRKVEIHDISGILKLPLDQYWPNLKELTIKWSLVCPMNLIKFCEKAPNIQDIYVHKIEKEAMMENKIDIIIKLINMLEKLSSFEIYGSFGYTSVHSLHKIDNGMYMSDDFYSGYMVMDNEFRCIRSERGDEIRYIRSQRVDETLRVEYGKPISKYFDVKEQLKNNNKD